MPVFVKDPSTYLDQLGVTLPCAADPARDARIDDDHLARVNYEMYYFAEERDRIAFRQDPRGRCGVITDPVSKQRFRPGSRSPREDHAGQPWYFVSDSTRALFAAMPDSFLSPQYSMKPVGKG